MKAGERCEWYWPNSELEEQIMIRVHSVKCKTPEESDDEGSFALSKKSKQTKVSAITEDRTMTSNLSDDDEVEWDWSHGMTLDEEKQMTSALMVREAGSEENMRTKVIKVSKKKVNGTTFVIFDQEDSLYPMYRIVNDCNNVRVHISQKQDSQDSQAYSDTVGPMTARPYGFYDP